MIRKALPSILIMSLLSIAFILIKPILVQAQVTSINEGVNWLLSNQNPDGSWSEDPRTYLDTFTAVKTLLLLEIDNAQVSQAINWINGLTPDNTDDLAHKILLLSRVNEDISSELSSLFVFQSFDNNWGVDQDFFSNHIDTTLALQALKYVNYPNLDTIGYAQNPDGGWAFVESDESNTYITSLVLKTLSAYSPIFDLQPDIANAAAYLLANQNTCGGFASSPWNFKDKNELLKRILDRITGLT